jgi:hypothetical protein
MKTCNLRIEIILETKIDEKWSVWFEGLSLIPIKGDKTKVFGEILDQAALHGLIERIRDLNLKFSSIIVEDL